MQHLPRLIRLVCYCSWFLSVFGTDTNESAFPRRSCVCDIGIVNHVMIMPIHEKSRPLKNCAVAVEYCKRICAPAVARQILGFREFGGLSDVALSIKPFWESQRSLGDALCQSLGRETSKSLDLAVYSQAKSCGRRVPATNGTFTEQLCCQQKEEKALIKAVPCTTSSPFALLSTVSAPSLAPTERVHHLLVTAKDKTIPEPTEIRARLRAQFRQFIHMLHSG